MRKKIRSEKLFSTLFHYGKICIWEISVFAPKLQFFPHWPCHLAQQNLRMYLKNLHKGSQPSIFSSTMSLESPRYDWLQDGWSLRVRTCAVKLQPTLSDHKTRLPHKLWALWAINMIHHTTMQVNSLLPSPSWQVAEETWCRDAVSRGKYWSLHHSF